MKPYYDDGSCVIYHGECREVMHQLRFVEAVDLVLTDPPYNVGIEYGDGHDDSMERIAYVNWCRHWFAMSRVICHRTIVFPGHGNLPVWWDIRRPSAVGCWHKPGANRSSVIGFVDWEPWLYWTGDKGDSRRLVHDCRPGGSRW